MISSLNTEEGRQRHAGDREPSKREEKGRNTVQRREGEKKGNE
jgi:hypothetical protein